MSVVYLNISLMTKAIIISKSYIDVQILGFLRRGACFYWAPTKCATVHVSHESLSFLLDVDLVEAFEELVHKR